MNLEPTTVHILNIVAIAGAIAVFAMIVATWGIFFYKLLFPILSVRSRNKTVAVVDELSMYGELQNIRAERMKNAPGLTSRDPAWHQNVERLIDVRHNARKKKEGNAVEK